MEQLLHKLLADVVLPPMARVEQRFPDDQIGDARAAVRAAMLESPAMSQVSAGMRVAVAVGSRGIDRLPELVAGMVEALRQRKAQPFIVPAMGSHGGGEAEGQLRILANLGVTEASAGCPIAAGAETVVVGRLSDGSPVHMNAAAQAADGIVVFNRIKPHSAFRANHESGIIKMLAVGLGNQPGADTCHRLGFAHLGRFIHETALVKLEAAPVLMGVGVVENAYTRLAHIFVCSKDKFIAEDARYLALARTRMPALPTHNLDLLIVDAIGKEFSGGGMDAGVTGRHPTPFSSGGPEVGALVVLDLAGKVQHNAIGVGLADVTTERLFHKINRKNMYATALTARVATSARVPMIMPDARTAIQAGARLSCAENPATMRVMRIPNTLHIGHLYASPALLPELAKRPGVTVLDEPAPMTFDAAGDPQQPWW